MSSKLDQNYNSLDRIDKWDPETQEIIKQRIANELGDTLSYEFLTPRESEILEFLVDALIPQEKNDKYIKISEIIDCDLAKNIKGVRYGKNPWPRDFYQTGLSDFAKQAQKSFGKPIEDFSASQIEKYISDIFKRNSDDFLRRFTRKVLSDATAIYFSHPASWNAIGFPGPAFPEGYPFLDCDKSFDWEPKYEK
jgi:hypothetical protein